MCGTTTYFELRTRAQQFHAKLSLRPLPVRVAGNNDIAHKSAPIITGCRRGDNGSLGDAGRIGLLIFTVFSTLRRH